jgi:hypothetical protein
VILLPPGIVAKDAAPIVRRWAHWRYRLGGRIACEDGSCSLHAHK